jgi:AcrR family transcriptional regulator
MTFSPMTEEERAARPDRLVQAARALANETGSAAFTVAQVTARSRLSLKSFYRCYQSKDDLLLALLAADSAIGAAVLAERIGDRSGAEGVRAYVIELFEMIQLPGAIGYAGVLVREYGRLQEEHDEALTAALKPLVDLLAAHIESLDPRRDAETMFSVLISGIHDLVLGRVVDASEHAEYLHHFCTRGVGL